MIFFLILFAHLHNVQVQKTLLKLLLKMSLLSTKVSGFFSGTFCHWQATVETQSWEINIILYPEEVAFSLKMKKKLLPILSQLIIFIMKTLAGTFSLQPASHTASIILLWKVRTLFGYLQYLQDNYLLQSTQTSQKNSSSSKS